MEDEAEAGYKASPAWWNGVAGNGNVAEWKRRLYSLVLNVHLDQGLRAAIGFRWALMASQV